MENLRTFVAIDINVEPLLKSKWEDLKILLRNDTVKWVDVRTIHLTLFFLGETTPLQVKEISKKLELVTKTIKPFILKINGLGLFGNPINPKVVWAGVSESQQLHLLKEIIDKTLLSEGFEDTQSKFSPHLTLGRIKHIKSANELNSFIRSNKSLHFFDVEVSKIIFYQSILTSNGPIYKPIKEFKLLSL